MEYKGSEQFRPLSPWSYFGHGILYSIPIVGLVFLIIHSISAANINRRNFARSYWCTLVLLLIVIGIVIIVGLVSGLLRV